MVIKKWRGKKKQPNFDGTKIVFSFSFSLFLNLALPKAKRILAGSSILKVPKQFYSIYSSLEKFKKPEGKNYNEKPDW